MIKKEITEYYDTTLGSLLLVQTVVYKIFGVVFYKTIYSRQ